MKKPRRWINLALIVVAVVAVVSAVVAAKSGGQSANTGNAQACNAFWIWYDGTGSSTPVTAYEQATTQPLIADLYNVSLGLQDKAKGLNGNKAENTAFANNAANNVVTDCSNAGYPDPES